MIELGMLEDMFSGMRAQTNWNVDGPMLWGYFFADRSPEKLEEGGDAFNGPRLSSCRIHETDDGSTRVLHV